MVNIVARQDSTIDYPGKMSVVVFTGGCNFNCGFCHNPEFIKCSVKNLDNDKLLRDIKLKSLRGWYQGVVISGGEPTIHSDLPEFIERLKCYGVAVKVDTNGSNPNMLERLLNGKLVDYIAMDVKAPRNLYEVVTGGFEDIEKIEESMKLLSGSGIDYEFRTTLVPVYYTEKNKPIFSVSKTLHKTQKVFDNGSFRWMDDEEISGIGKWIVSITGRNEHKYFLQRFVAREAEMIDERFRKSNLAKEFRETPEEVLDERLKEIKKYLSNADVRGY